MRRIPLINNRNKKTVKLSADLVNEIRELKKTGGLTVVEISTLLNISIYNILGAIYNRKIWKEI